MIACEFSLAPEELLYSAVARFRDRMRYPAEGCIWEVLFGSNSGVSTVELPGNLQQVVSRIGDAAGLSAEALVRGHTTLPYYTPYVEPARAARAAETLVTGSASTLYGLLGIRASTIPTPVALRYCAQCLAEDREQRGAGIWRRAHQLPSVLICVRHQTALRESTAVRSNRADRTVFWSVDAAAADADPPAWTGHPPPFIVWAAAASESLVQGTLLGPGLAVIHSKYRELSHEAGYARGRRQIAMARLREAFLAHHGARLLAALRCPLAAEPDAEDWLAGLLRRPRAAKHPLHHLLMAHFLAAPAESIIAPPRCNAAPPAHTTGTCRNPVCAIGHPDLTPRDRCTAEQHACRSCGFSFRRGPGERSRTVVLAFGSVWEDRLRSLVRDPNVGLRAAARALGVDPKTLQRHAARLGVSRPGWPNPPALSATRADAPAPTRDRHRNAWSRMRTDSPQATMSELRTKLPTAYSYLFRFDRAWLDEHRPPRAKPRGRRERVRWPERDRRLLECARMAVERIRARPSRPVRLSRALIARSTGHSALIEQHLDRLPGTRAYLEAVVESRTDFALRRLRWCSDGFIRRGSLPERWVLTKDAGLRKDLADQLRGAVSRELARIAECLSSLGAAA